jgi:hypothetical protein
MTSRDIGVKTVALVLSRKTSTVARAMALVPLVWPKPSP